MFGRCTRSIGLAVPAYLADKAGDRARCYARDQYTGGSHEEYDASNPDHQLNISVHENLKNKMYYL